LWHHGHTMKEREVVIGLVGGKHYVQNK